MLHVKEETNSTSQNFRYNGPKVKLMDSVDGFKDAAGKRVRVAGIRLCERTPLILTTMTIEFLLLLKNTDFVRNDSTEYRLPYSVRSSLSRVCLSSSNRNFVLFQICKTFAHSG